jgi:signal transduction histidine kinase
LVSLAVTAAATSTYLIIGYPFGPALISTLFAVYAVASRLPIRVAAPASAAALVVLLVHNVVRPELPGQVPLLGAMIIGAAWVVVPFALGVVVRQTRESVARQRADLARRYADEERLRIAQEVHDVVGHGLAAIRMQAEIALHVLPQRPEQAEAALTVISQTSKEALDELRATLAVVRRGDDGRSPRPGLNQLDALVARVSGAGVPVRVEVSGNPRDLPAAVNLVAYRIVQESLTNVLRHARSAMATVHLGYGSDVLDIEVTDTGGGTISAGRDGRGADGHGIAGMRERAEAVGGSLDAGRRAGGGWRVAARLPFQGGSE